MTYLVRYVMTTMYSNITPQDDDIKPQTRYSCYAHWLEANHPEYVHPLADLPHCPPLTDLYAVVAEAILAMGM